MADLPSFARNVEARRRRRRGWRILIYTLVAIVGFTVAFAGSLTWTLLRGIRDEAGEDGQTGRDVIEASPLVPADEPLNILVLGTDAGLSEGGRHGPKRSDTMMLVSVDPLTDQVSIISIPRDTQVRIPEERLDEEQRRHIYENPTKIAHAHAFGGPEVAMATVSEFLGVPVHRYVRVDLQAFVNIVDLVGGVDICVEKNMFYQDPYQDLYIDLKKGCQRLDGEHALQYVRYRQDSDLARIERQHKTILALIDRVLRLGMIPRLPELVRQVTTHVDTNLSDGEILRLVGLATKLASRYPEEGLATATIPGRDAWVKRSGGRIYYWIADDDAVRQIVDTLIWRLPVPEGVSATVRIRDGSGSAGAAQELASYLESYGYEVVEVVPGESAATTEIYLHREDAIGGKLVARALVHKLKTARGYLRPAADSDVDLTIALGRDYGRSDHRLGAHPDTDDHQDEEGS
ncbi:MAG TPA: LCP family protein [Bacillota bacterium]